MTDNWQPMATAPRDEPVMLRIRDPLGTYEAGPFIFRDGEWWSDGGKHSHKLDGETLVPLAHDAPFKLVSRTDGLSRANVTGDKP